MSHSIFQSDTTISLSRFFLAQTHLENGFRRRLAFGQIQDLQRFSLGHGFAQKVGSFGGRVGVHSRFPGIL